jgi:DNA-binding transcriptional LysR family regulator
MRLRHVEVFQAVMETGSMSAAGRLIHLTQSAVSRLIASAERQLECRLFHRISGRLVPTEEALTLFEASSEVFEKLDALRQTAAQLRVGRRGRLRIAATPALSHKLLPDVLAQFQERYPDMVCEIRTLHKRQMTEALIARRTDIGFEFFGTDHPGMQAQIVGAGALYVMLPASERGRASSSREGMVRHCMMSLPMIALIDDDPVAGAFARYCKDESLKPLLRAEVQTHQLAEELVARGMGWAVVDFLTASQSRHDVVIEKLHPVVECPVTMLATKSDPPSLPARRFAEVAKEVLNRYAASSGLFVPSSSHALATSSASP